MEVSVTAQERWKVYPGFPIGLPWVPVFPAVFVRFPHIKRSPVGSRVFSGFHSSSYDPESCTLGSRRNNSSPWVPCPIEVDGGSWRTGAQEHSAAFPTRTAAARLVSRMSSEAEELSDAGQGAISAEESLSDGSGGDEIGSCRNRKNKTGIKRSPSEWDPICTNVSEDEVLQAVENARKVELGVGSLGRAKNIWKPKPPLFNKQGVRRLILRCPQAPASGCRLDVEWGVVCHVTQMRSSARTCSRKKMRNGNARRFYNLLRVRPSKSANCL